MNKVLQLVMLALFATGNALFAAGEYGEYSLLSTITQGKGGFEGVISSGDYFSRVSDIGDVNKDGINDLAVGADTDGSGAVYILFMKEDGTVKSHYKIDDNEAYMKDYLSSGNGFGRAIEPIGDIDGDGNVDIIVSAFNSNSKNGAVWVLFLKEDGSVRDATEITGGKNGFNESLTSTDYFGIMLQGVGDMDNDGVTDIAVTGAFESDGHYGKVFLMYLNADGTVKSYKDMTNNGVFDGVIKKGERFGGSISKIGDVNNDGYEDLAVTSFFSEGGDSQQGVIYILFLDENQDVIGYQDITAGVGGFEADFSTTTSFGFTIDGIGDINKDGTIELLTFARPASSDDEHKIWILSLNEEGKVVKQINICESLSEMVDLSTGDVKIARVEKWGGLLPDGSFNIALGNLFYDGNGTNTGEVYVVNVFTGLSTLSGTVTFEDGALGNEEVILYDKSTPDVAFDAVYSSNGDYTFINVPEGEYILKLVASEDADYQTTFYGDVTSQDDAVVVSLPAATDLTDIDIAAVPVPKGTISGTVTFDGGNLDNVEVVLYDKSTPDVAFDAVYSSEGNYTFIDVRDGEYIIKLVASEGAGYQTTFYGDVTRKDDVTIITIPAGSDLTEVDIAAVPVPKGSISGTVTFDGENLDNVEVMLLEYDNFSTVVETVYTVDGLYTFESVDAGGYSVKIMGDIEKDYVTTFYGNMITEESATKIELSPGEEVVDADIIVQPMPATAVGDVEVVVSIGPNPAKEFILVKSEKSQEFILTIYNMSGSVLLTEVVEGGTRIDVSSFTSGVYLAEIKCGDFVDKHVFIKE